jgi:hypothetical protein
MTDRSSSPALPLYQTDLAHTPLPEILAKIHRYRVPGVIDCRRDDVDKRIYLDGGQIIFATSSVRDDSLGDKLLREGSISREQYDESVLRMKESGKRQGVVLAEMKAIEPKQLFVSIRDQIQEIVWSVFAWESGAVSFMPGSFKKQEFVKLDIAMPRAILQGVRRMPDARALVARLGIKTTVFERTEDEIDFVLKPEEQTLLDAVNGKKVLVELVATPPLAQADNAKILYAFFALGLIAVRASRQIKVQLKTDGERYQV